MDDVFNLIVAEPWLALLPALSFLVLGRLRRRRFVTAVGIVWALYFAYEWSIHARLTCSGECDIRIDLLVLAPLLTALTALALTASVWPTSRRSVAGRSVTD